MKPKAAPRQVPCAPVDKWLLERAMTLLGNCGQAGGLKPKAQQELCSLLGALPKNDAEALHWKQQLKNHRKVMYG